MNPDGNPLTFGVPATGRASDQPGARAMNPADRKPESTFEIRKLSAANSVRSATGQLAGVWQAAGSTDESFERRL
jgi:hypothetical protein